MATDIGEKQEEREREENGGIGNGVFKE